MGSLPGKTVPNWVKLFFSGALKNVAIKAKLKLVVSNSISSGIKT